jgi:predicted nucleic acid-binding protein
VEKIEQMTIQKVVLDAGHSALPFIKIPVLENRDSPIVMLCNAFNLDEGEKQAVVLCFQHQDSILLTDDAAARLAAKSIGIKTHGTVGILLRAIRRKQLTPQEVIKHLEEIPLKSTLFIKSSLLTEIIEELRKEYNI